MNIPDYARGYADFPGQIGRTTATSHPSWPKEAKAAQGSPNVIVIVADDLGYSDLSPYGSEIQTPNLQRIADQGVTMANYHTAPMCSPARASLLTGLNPHRAGFGFVSNADPGYPGMRIEFGEGITTLPAVLRDNGYATMAFGKWHLVREANMHSGASKKSWPCQQGFDHFYGSLEGLNSFFEPNQLIVDNSVHPVETWPEDYYVTDDLTDRAVSQILDLRSANPDKPFFCYFAHLAVHAPLQVPAAVLAEQHGKYAAGWDALREARFARQQQLGLFGAQVQQAPRNSTPGYDVAAWDELGAEEQERFAKYMEAYAAMVVTIDRSVGRLMDTLEELGELENTVIIVTSDNGASAEGGEHGTRSYYRMFPNSLAELGWEGDTGLDVDLIGTRDCAAHYPRGWAQTSNTPFRYYKGQTFAGGVRVPFIASWPGAPEKMQGTRHQFSYVSDVAPTILDLLGIEHPGLQEQADVAEPDGVSAAAIWQDAQTETAHPLQYAEITGHRGLYSGRWKLLSLFDKQSPVDEPVWQLYDMATDPTELHDVAALHPQLVAELAAQWDREAWRNTVFPLLEARGPGAGALAARRPDDEYLLKPVTVLPGTPVLERYRSLELIQYRDFEVQILLDGSESTDQGVLLSHGDAFGGYILYVENGMLTLGYNCYGEPILAEVGPWAAGISSLVLEARVVDPLRWTFSIGINGEPVREVLAQVPQMTGMVPWTGIAIGRDPRGPVLRGLRERQGTFPWTGKLRKLTYVPGVQRPISELRADLEVVAARRAD